MTHRTGENKSIAIHVDLDKSFFYPFSKLCPKWGQIRQRNSAYLEANSDKKFIWLKEKLASSFARKASDLDWNYLAEALLCRIAYQKDLPPDIPQETILKYCDYIAQRMVYQYSCDDESCRLAFGVLLDKLVHSMKHDDGMLRIASCHDGTILALLAALKKDDLGWPSYAATVTFE
ncbi:hypothetical protein RFI_32039, partial [Reticulomyxa filosa]